MVSSFVERLHRRRRQRGRRLLVGLVWNNSYAIRRFIAAYDT